MYGMHPGQAMKTQKQQLVSSLVAQIDRLSHLDIVGSTQLNAALNRSGFDPEGKTLLAQAIAHKSLESVFPHTCYSIA